MLHTNFRGNWSIGSGEDFEGVLPYKGVAAILAMWPRCREQIFALIDQDVSEEKLKIIDGRRTIGIL